MRIRQGFLLKKLADEYTAIPYDENYENLGAMVSLNDTGAFLWHCLEEETSFEDLVSALAHEYAIDDALAEDAVNAFLEELREHHLLEETIDGKGNTQ
ncbi:MAG: PqqD family protein [Clostridia bacterium]|nr:PqqD family protein [Clostridia bacterium]